MSDKGVQLHIYVENGQLKVKLDESTRDVKKFGAEAQRAGKDGAAGFDQLGKAGLAAANRIRESIDPARKLHAEIVDIRRLAARGIISESTAARGVAALRSQIERVNGGLSTMRTRGQAAVETFRDLRRTIVAAWAAHEVVQFIGAIVDANVEMQKIHYTFQAATGSAAAARKEWKFVSKVAEELGLNARVAGSGLADMEAAAAGANEPLKDARDLWLAVAKAQVVYHLNAEQAKAVTLALTQMMAKGKIQSQELQLQLSQALPIGVLSRFAKAIGVSVTQLQSMMQNGALLTDKYLPALSQAIRSAVDPSSLSEAEHGLNAELNRLHSIIFGIEAGDKTTFVDSFTQSVQELNKTLSDPGIQKGIANIISGLGHLVEWAVKAAAAIGHVADGVGNMITPTSLTAGSVPTSATTLQARMAADKKAANELEIAIAQLETREGRPAPEIMRTRLANLQLEIKNLTRVQNQGADAVKRYNDLMAGGTGAGGKPKQGGTSYGPTPAQKAATAAADQAQQAQAALAAQEILLKDSLARKKRALDAALAANEISYKRYYADVAKIQRQGLQEQIAAQQAKLRGVDAAIAQQNASGQPDAAAIAKLQAKRLQLTAQLITLQRQLGDVAVDTAHKETAANTALNKQLDGVKQKLLSIADPVAAAKAKIEAQYADLIAKLRAQGRNADVKLVMKLELQQEDQAAADAIKAKATQVFDGLKTAQQTLANKVQIGSLTPAGAQAALAGDQQNASQQIDQLIAKARALHSALGDQLVAALEKTKKSILGLKQPIGEVATSVIDGLLNKTQQFFTQWFTGTKNAKAAALDFARGVAQMLEQIAAKIVTMQAINAILSAFGYNINSTGQIAAVAAQAHAAGGPIDGAGTDTSDNVLSWLSPGEWVLRAKAVRALVRNFGHGFLERLNHADSSLPRFAGGGFVGMVPSGSSMQRAFGGGMNVTVPVTINGNSSDPQADEKTGRELGRKIKHAVQKIMLEEKRPGGLLYQATGA